MWLQKQMACWAAVLFCVVMAEGAEVTIEVSEPESVLYINGKEKAVIKGHTVQLDIPDGKYEIMVSKKLDEEWQMVSRRNIVLHDTPASVKLDLDIEKISKKSNTSKASNFKKENDTVLDKIRHLRWQDDTRTVEIRKSWQEAQAYCSALTVDGMHRWRLPSYDELVSIVDYTKHTLAIMPAFSHIVSDSYWSATPDEGNVQQAKSIYFGNGCPNEESKEKRFLVRCVRKEDKRTK